MIHTICSPRFSRRAWPIHLHINGMKRSIRGGQGERETVFVAHDFRDFLVRFLKRFGIHWEIRAATGEGGDCLQVAVLSRKLVLRLPNLHLSALLALS